MLRLLRMWKQLRRTPKSHQSRYQRLPISTEYQKVEFQKSRIKKVSDAIYISDVILYPLHSKAVFISEFILRASIFDSQDSFLYIRGRLSICCRSLLSVMPALSRPDRSLPDGQRHTDYTAGPFLFT